jgi:hypothetical protein
MIAASSLTRPHTSSSFICYSFSSCQVWRTGWPGTRTTMTDSIYHQFKYCVNGQANWGGGPPCCKDIFNMERKILQRSCSSSCAKYWLSSAVKLYSRTSRRITRSSIRLRQKFAECDVGICLQVNGEDFLADHARTFMLPHFVIPSRKNNLKTKQKHVP